MAFLGQAAVCTWNDVAPDGRENFYQWHTREHMPERLAIPGFNRGRRFIAHRGSPEFFFLYEATNLATVGGIDYLDRLNNPTPWTQRSTKDFRNSFRSVGRISLSIGTGTGGFIATIRFDADDPVGLEAAMTDVVMPPIEPMVGIIGVHLMIGDPKISNTKTTEREGRGAPFAFVPWVLMIEGVSEAAIDGALGVHSLPERLVSLGAKAPFETSIYRMEVCRN